MKEDIPNPTACATVFSFGHFKTLTGWSIDWSNLYRSPFSKASVLTHAYSSSIWEAEAHNGYLLGEVEN